MRKIAVPEKRQSDKVIIHIQDVHSNSEVQANIGGAVQKLIDDGRVDLIALEGAFGPINFGGFRRFSDQNTIRKVADYLLQESQISGPVYTALISSGAIPAVVGVDDPAHYRLNVAAYRQAARLLKGYRKDLTAAKRELVEEKRKTFNPQLMIFDERVEAYRAGRVQMGDHIRALSKTSPDVPASVQLFLEALQIESSLNFSRVEDERTKLIAELIEKLNEGQSSELVNFSVAYRVGRIRHADFYRYVRDICAGSGVDLLRYPAMDAYVRYVVLSDRIDAERVFDGMRQLENEGYAALVRSPREARLVSESRRLHLAGRLLDFALTPQEWKEYKSARIPSSFVGSLDLSPFESFYQQAELRDRAMAANLLREMERRKARVAVLVTGGFHARGIEDGAGRSGASVISFVPRITKIDSSGSSAYLSVFTQEKSPLDTLFEGDQLFLSPPHILSIRRTILFCLAELARKRADLQSGFRALAPKSNRRVSASVFRVDGRTFVDLESGGRAVGIGFDEKGNFLPLHQQGKPPTMSQRLYLLGEDLGIAAFYAYAVLASLPVWVIPGGLLFFVFIHLKNLFLDLRGREGTIDQRSAGIYLVSLVSFSTVLHLAIGVPLFLMLNGHIPVSLPTGIAAILWFITISHLHARYSPWALHNLNDVRTRTGLAFAPLMAKRRSDKPPLASPEQKLKVAVVGAGSMGENHIRKLIERPDVEVSLFDSNPERNHVSAQKFGIESFPSLEAVADWCQAAIVAVPTPLHFLVAQFLLNRGVHLLIEKPITETRHEADSLIRLAHERNLVLQTGHIERFNPAFVGLMALVSTPLLILGWRLTPPVQRQMQVAVGLDLMIHDLDLLLRLVSDRTVLSLDAVVERVDVAFENVLTATILFQKGVTSVLHASRSSDRPVRSMVVVQEDSILIADYLNRRVRIIRPTSDGSSTELVEPAVGQWDALEQELAHFLDAVRQARPATVSGEDGREALSLVQDIQENTIEAQTSQERDVRSLFQIEQEFDESQIDRVMAEASQALVNEGVAVPYWIRSAAHRKKPLRYLSTLREWPARLWRIYYRYFGIRISGREAHSGNPIETTVTLGKKGEGIRFIRTDLDLPESERTLPANLESTIGNTTGFTALARNNVRVGLIEHYMAALRVLGIFDARIYVNSEQMPLLDGGAAELLDKLKPLARLFARPPPQIVLDHPAVFERAGKTFVIVLPLNPEERHSTITFVGDYESLPDIPVEFSSELDDDSRIDRRLEKMAPLMSQPTFLASDDHQFPGLNAGGNVVFLHRQLSDDDEEKNRNAARSAAMHKWMDAVGDTSLLAQTLGIRRGRSRIGGHFIFIASGHQDTLAAMKLYLDYPDGSRQRATYLSAARERLERAKVRLTELNKRGRLSADLYESIVTRLEAGERYFHIDKATFPESPAKPAALNPNSLLFILLTAVLGLPVNRYTVGLGIVGAIGEIAGSFFLLVGGDIALTTVVLGLLFAFHVLALFGPYSHSRIDLRALAWQLLHYLVVFGGYLAVGVFLSEDHAIAGFAVVAAYHLVSDVVLMWSRYRWEALSVVPIVDVSITSLALRWQIIRAVWKAMVTGHYVNGPNVQALEREVARICGTRYAVAVNSGTDAGILIARALGIGPGDEIITVPFTFFATVEAIHHVGAKPVFVDIDPRTFNMDPEQLRRAITPRTRAILAVHLYGQPADMDPILAIAAEKGIPVIEDMAQALGATYQGEPVGSLGRAAIVSFYPTKNLGALGDGGMVLTNDAELAERVRLLAQHGARRVYEHEVYGYNSRLDAIQAAILLIKLRFLRSWNERRFQLARSYHGLLSDLPVVLPETLGDRTHVFNLYTLRVPNGHRDALQKFLEERGVMSRVHYPTPLHLQPALSALGHEVGHFVESERAAQEVLSLPLYPQMTERQVRRVAQAVREFFDRPESRSPGAVPDFPAPLAAFGASENRPPNVHPTAIVHPSAQLGDGVTIGPGVIINADVSIANGVTIGAYSVIGPRVKIGERCQIQSHVVIEYTEMGEGNVVFPGVKLGLAPQHALYKGEATMLQIGKGNTFREDFTAHRGTSQSKESRGVTVIGDNGLFMVGAHVAHDCHVGNGVIMVNGAKIAGHVRLEDDVTLSGNVVVHQWVRIGAGTFVGGGTAIVQDVAPFTILRGDGKDFRGGVNTVGLRRKGVEPNTIRLIRDAYKIVFRRGLALSEALERPELNVENPFIETYRRFLVNVAREYKRGLTRPRSERQGKDDSVNPGGTPGAFAIWKDLAQAGRWEGRITLLFGAVILFLLNLGLLPQAPPEGMVTVLDFASLVFQNSLPSIAVFLGLFLSLSIALHKRLGVRLPGRSQPAYDWTTVFYATVTASTSLLAIPFLLMAIAMLSLALSFGLTGSGVVLGFLATIFTGLGIYVGGAIHERANVMIESKSSAGVRRGIPHAVLVEEARDAVRLTRALAGKDRRAALQILMKTRPVGLNHPTISDLQAGEISWRELFQMEKFQAIVETQLRRLGETTPLGARAVEKQADVGGIRYFSGPVALLLLEEALRALLICAVPGWTTSVLLYPVLHAALHIAKDVREAGWKGAAVRLPARFALSALFGLGFQAGAGLAAQEMASASGFGAATTLHLLNNTLVVRFVRERFGWNWLEMSVGNASGSHLPHWDPSWEEPTAEEKELADRMARRILSHQMTSGMFGSELLVGSARVTPADVETPVTAARSLRSLFFSDPDFVAALLLTFKHRDHDFWRRALTATKPGTSDFVIEHEILAAMLNHCFRVRKKLSRSGFTYQGEAHGPLSVATLEGLGGEAGYLQTARGVALYDLLDTPAVLGLLDSIDVYLGPRPFLRARRKDPTIEAQSVLTARRETLRHQLVSAQGAATALIGPDANDIAEIQPFLSYVQEVGEQGFEMIGANFALTRMMEDPEEATAQQARILRTLYFENRDLAAALLITSGGFASEWGAILEARHLDGSRVLENEVLEGLVNRMFGLFREHLAGRKTILAPRAEREFDLYKFPLIVLETSKERAEFLFDAVDLAYRSLLVESVVRVLLETGDAGRRRMDPLRRVLTEIPRSDLERLKGQLTPGTRDFLVRERFLAPKEIQPAPRVSSPIAREDGERVGRLYVLDDPDDQVQFTLPAGSILATESLQTTEENSPRAGYLTYSDVGTGCHAASLARLHNIPHALLPGPDYQIAGDLTLRDLHEKMVYLRVHNDVVEIREARPEEMHLQRLTYERDKPIVLAQADLTETSFVISPDDERLGNVAHFGHKVADTVTLELPELSDPGIELKRPDSWGIPFNAFYRVLLENRKLRRYLFLVRELNVASGARAERIRTRLEQLVLSLHAPDGFMETLESSGFVTLIEETGVFVRGASTAEGNPENPEFGVGINRTLFNIRDRAVLWDAFLEVWASIWSANSYGSRAQLNVSQEEIHQSLWLVPSVPARYSGIIHTRNISTGKPNEVLVELIEGLGPALVDSGLFPGRPTRLELDARTGKVLFGRPSAKSNQLQLAEGGGTVEERLQPLFEPDEDPEEIFRELVKDKILAGVDVSGSDLIVTLRTGEFLLHPDRDRLIRALWELADAVNKTRDAQEIEFSLVENGDGTWSLVPLQSRDLKVNGGDQPETQAPADQGPSDAGPPTPTEQDPDPESTDTANPSSLPYLFYLAAIQPNPTALERVAVGFGGAILEATALISAAISLPDWIGGKWQGVLGAILFADYVLHLWLEYSIAKRKNVWPSLWNLLGHGLIFAAYLAASPLFETSPPALAGVFAAHLGADAVRLWRGQRGGARSVLSVETVERLFAARDPVMDLATDSLEKVAAGAHQAPHEGHHLVIVPAGRTLTAIRAEMEAVRRASVEGGEQPPSLVVFLTGRRESWASDLKRAGVSVVRQSALGRAGQIESRLERTLLAPAARGEAVTFVVPAGTDLSEPVMAALQALSRREKYDRLLFLSVLQALVPGARTLTGRLSDFKALLLSLSHA